MLGREVTQSLQLMAGVREERAPVHAFVEAIQGEMQRIHELTQEALQKQQKGQKRDYDIHARSAKYAVRDVVLLMNSATRVGQSKKLAPLWKEPFIIMQVIPPVLYQIASSKKEWVVHHDRLRRCDNDPLPLWLRRKRHTMLENSLSDSPVTLPHPSDPIRGPLTEKPVFCICRKPDDGHFMIACDACYEWFHGKCVQITEEAALAVDYYHCPECKRQANVV